MPDEDLRPPARPDRHRRRPLPRRHPRHRAGDSRTVLRPAPVAGQRPARQRGTRRKHPRPDRGRNLRPGGTGPSARLPDTQPNRRHDPGTQLWARRTARKTRPLEPSREAARRRRSRPRAAAGPDSGRRPPSAARRGPGGFRILIWPRPGLRSWRLARRAGAEPAVPVASGAVEMGQGTLSGLQDVLSASGQEVFVRAALHSGLLAVRYLDVTVGAPAEPPGWKPGVWKYESASFIAASA